MAHFLVTGGTGFIGSVLIRNLSEAGHHATVLTRQPNKYTDQIGGHIRYESSFNAIDDNEVFQAVINLGGEGIGDKLWSEKRKQVLLDSRIELTKQLVACLKRLNTRPEVMISGSALVGMVPRMKTLSLRMLNTTLSLLMIYVSSGKRRLVK